MSQMLSFERLRSILVADGDALAGSADPVRKAKYEMADAALALPAVFYVQSPSFLAHQRDMQRLKGQNNAASLFGSRRGALRSADS